MRARLVVSDSGWLLPTVYIVYQVLVSSQTVVFCIEVLVLLFCLWRITGMLCSSIALVL